MTAWFLVLAVVVAGLFATLYLVSIGSRSDLSDEVATYRSCYRAARWQARRNYAYAAALQDIIARKLKLSYHTIHGMTRDQLDKQPYYGTISQTVNMAQVPATLHSDAAMYNYHVLKEWQNEYAMKVIDTLSAAEQRAQQMEMALFIMTRAEPQGVLEDIAEGTGVPLPHVRAVAMALRSRAEYDLQRIVGEVERTLEKEN
jgi:hypothetical protein